MRRKIERLLRAPVLSLPRPLTQHADYNVLDLPSTTAHRKFRNNLDMSDSNCDYEPLTLYGIYYWSGKQKPNRISSNVNQNQNDPSADSSSIQTDSSYNKSKISSEVPMIILNSTDDLTSLNNPEKYSSGGSLPESRYSAGSGSWSQMTGSLHQLGHMSVQGRQAESDPQWPHRDVVPITLII